MAFLLHPLSRLGAGVACATSLAVCLLGPASASAAGAPCTNTTDGVSVVLASPSGGNPTPACVTQQGNVLIIVLPPNATTQTVPAVPPPLVRNTPATTPLNADLTPSAPPLVTEGNMANVVDPRINSYARRQAIRDQYRGQIDEVTFNDELGDGVTLETALADALAAFKHPR